MMHKSVTIEEADNGYIVRMYMPSKEGESGMKMSVHESMDGAMKAMMGMMKMKSGNMHSDKKPKKPTFKNGIRQSYG